MRWCFLSFALLALAGCSPRTKVVEIDAASTSAGLSDVEPASFAKTDWPMWRGPNGNNIVPDSDAPLVWSESENVVWKSPVPGRGHGSPIVVGSQVFLATSDKGSQTQSILAFDRATGKQLWSKQVGKGELTSKMHAKSTHANGTLACDGKLVFGAFLNHDSIHVVAVSVDGELAWTMKVGAFASNFGYAPSPTIFGPLVIIAADNQGGGYLAGLNRNTGDIVWRKSRGNASSYSSPIVGKVNGKHQLLISGNDKLAGYDPMTGKEFWSLPAIAQATCGTAVFNETMVFASGGYPNKQTIGVTCEGSATQTWSNGKKIYEPSMLLVGDHLYGITDAGVAYCWQAATGDEAWKKRLGGNFSASPILVRDQILAMSDNGSCIVFQATADGFKSTARNQLGDDAYATPTVAGNDIFIRIGTGSAGKRQEFLYRIGKSDTDSNQVTQP